MDRHECRHCGRKFNYCRACMLKPIPWRDAGFCSKECSADFKAAQIKEEVIPVEDVEVVVIDEDTSTQSEDAVEYPYFFTDTEIKQTKKKKEKIVDYTLEEKIEDENE